MALSGTTTGRAVHNTLPLDGYRVIPVGDPNGVAGRRRLHGVDAFRGAVLALMLLTPPIAASSFPCSATPPGTASRSRT